MGITARDDVTTRAHLQPVSGSGFCSLTPTTSSQTSMPDPSALMAHVVSQTRQNVEFLINQGEISRDAGRLILDKLPIASDVTLRDLSEQTRRMTIPSAASPQPSTDYAQSPTPPSGPPVRRNPQPSQPGVQRAKALWSYNESGSVGTL